MQEEEEEEEEGVLGGAAQRVCSALHVFREPEVGDLRTRNGDVYTRTRKQSSKLSSDTNSTKYSYVRYEKGITCFVI